MTEQMDVLDLGCGNDPIDGAIGVDIRDFPNADVQANASDLPFADNTFDKVFSDQVFEHFDRDTIPQVMNEVWRVLKPDGELEFRVPVGRAYYGDITHVTEWSLKSLAYLLPEKEHGKLGYDHDSIPDYYADYEFEYRLIEWSAPMWIDAKSVPGRAVSSLLNKASSVIETDKWAEFPLVGGNLVFRLQAVKSESA